MDLQRLTAPAAGIVPTMACASCEHAAPSHVDGTGRCLVPHCGCSSYAHATTAPPAKYENVRVVAKVPCQTCGGTGKLPRPEGPARTLDNRMLETTTCARCGGTGERDQELLHHDEPFFLVRGQDYYARTAVMLYAALRLGDDAEHDEQVGGWTALMSKAAEIAEWQAANPSLVKKPD